MTTKPTRTTAKVAPAKAAAKAVSKPEKKLKKSAADDKVVRDSFTMPQSDYALIAELKEKAIAGGLHVKKSELLRAGLRLLAKSNLAQLKRAVSGLEKIKTGRPKKD